MTWTLRFARRAGFDVIGTIGLLLAARLRREIASLRAELERLDQVGFCISDDLAEAVLRAAGENEDGTEAEADSS